MNATYDRLHQSPFHGLSDDGADATPVCHWTNPFVVYPSRIFRHTAKTRVAHCHQTSLLIYCYSLECDFAVSAASRNSACWCWHWVRAYRKWNQCGPDMEIQSNDLALAVSPGVWQKPPDAQTSNVVRCNRCDPLCGGGWKTGHR